ncbi:hypothetical protein XBKB1_3950034 [Xenorhabdus bovienii str. kraussei Becker Underwood]|uniref:Uncharacterized protein n=1 Tax=Xenorhabdus bovienii str. kraussei Becker Underwood TaxID=1398204 RepID=A0A077PZT4_XENBV|nr:hypothetical protein XBKB1_3950034 [Xenorhabdus bovienii str. kraussei Becker Underwood]
MHDELIKAVEAGEFNTMPAIH